MQRCILILLVMMVSSSWAFTASSISRVYNQPQRHHTQRHMFSTDGSESSSQSSTSTTVNTASPLQVVETLTAADASQPAIRTSTPVERPKMVAKNMNTGEIKQVKWVDPAMQAHTNPLQMDWYVFTAIVHLIGKCVELTRCNYFLML